MESEFTLTTEEIWKNTIRTVESAYCWLLLYEGKDYELVDNSITTLRKLITHGKNYESIKSYRSSDISIPTPSKTSQRKKNNYTPITRDLEPNWTQLDDHTIRVDLDPSSNGGGQTAICISVTTASQLDQVIEDVYKSKCIAVDCEFMGVSKSLPKLKLLQIGVSKYKGYAIQVDIIGVKVVTDKLKSILEDESLDIIGWAFRSDALAIESYIQGIELAPVLDLQAKLKPIALEEMKLGSALDKFASDWIGNNEFQKAKLTGTQFNYTGEDCVWLISPLPPKALVYAVFDVLSVWALHEYTQHYPSEEKFYWPMTVISSSSQKAVDRWHVQRATGINSNPDSGKVSVVKPKSFYKPPMTKRPSSASNALPVRHTEDGYDDQNDQYQRDLQLAIALSVKEVTQGEPSGVDRVIESPRKFSSTLESIANELNSKENVQPRFSDAPVQETNDAKIEYETWGTKMLDEQPFIGHNFASQSKPSPSAPPATQSYQWSNDTTTKHQWDTNENDTKELPSQWGDASLNQSEKKSIQKVQTSGNQWSQYTEVATQQWINNWDKGSPNQWKDPKASASPKKSYSSPKPTEQKLKPMVSPNVSHSRTTTQASPKLESPQFISCKPDKKKYTSDLKNRIQVGNQGGSFTWAPERKDQMSNKTWKSFVSSTIDDWKNGKDTTIDAIMNPSISEHPRPSSAPIKFNTKVQENYTRGGKIGDNETGTMNTDHNQDNWEVKEERPDIMQMPMNQIPIRTKFTGPRIENPYADDDDSDDDSYQNEDDDDEEPYNDNDFPIIKGNMPLFNKNKEKTKSQIVESLPTFVDGLYLYNEDEEVSELSMLKLTTPEELDMVYIPPKEVDFTVAVGFHFIRGPRGYVVKAIQAYVSTGESYTALVERTFMMRPAGSLQNTKFGKLLTDPSIKRVCWSPEYLEEELQERLGFKIGPCIDLAFKTNCGKEDTISFLQAVDYYLQDWPDRKQFMEAKKDFETLNAKKFSSTCWDREKLPESVLKYSALQGLASYYLYQKTLKVIDQGDEYFMYGT